jgi:PAS domain-containing protein
MGQEFVVGRMDVAPGAVAVLFAHGSAPVVGSQLAGLDRKAVSVIVWREKIEGPGDIALHEAVRRSGFILLPWTDGALLEAGCLYVVLPHRRVWFDRARLRMGERREFEAFPIDRFLKSMVRAWGCRSIVVAPDLIGGDGQRGLTAVRQAGGAVVSARSTAAGPARRTSAAALANVEAPAPARPKRPPAPSFRVGRLFPFNSAVLVQLRAAAAAAVKQAGSRDRLRVWVPACKTGGLVYGVAMLLRDMFVKVSSPPRRLQVFGTDDDEEALAVARAGRYPAHAGIGMDPHLRGQYTFDEGDAIRMAETLRELCVFSTHKLTRNAPFSRMDLIVCHRVFDGLPPSRRDDVSDELCYALREEGALVAVDHRQHFQTDQFELMPEGYLRPRPTRARALLARVQKASNPRSRFAAGGSNTPRRLPPVPKSVASAPRAQNHDAEQASMVDLERLMRAIGVPLLLLDSQLGVMYVSAAASRMFELPTVGRGLPLQVLAPRLPGGTDLVHAAERVARTGSTEEVVVGAGAQSYLVRVSSGLRSGGDGVTIVFIDVGAFDASPRVPFRE